VCCGGRPSLSGAARPGEQLGLFSVPVPDDDELTRRLAGLDVNRLTPIDALTTLAGLVKDAKARL